MTDRRLDELRSEDETHPSTEDLLRLHEAAVDAGREEELWAHLVRCRRCFATLAEISRSGITWDLGVPLPRTPEAYLAAARAIPDRRRPPGGRGGLLGALALAAAALFAFVLYEPGSGTRPPAWPPGLRAEAAAVPDWTFLPGESASSEILRGGAGEGETPREEVSRLVAEFRDRDHEGTLDAGLAYVVVASYLTLGELANAETFLYRARQVLPADADLRTLDAAVADRRNRPEEALAILHEVLEEHPDNRLARANLNRLLADGN